MSKFRFETLLKIRASERDDKKNALLEIRQILTTRAQEVARLEARRDELHEESRRLRRETEFLRSSQLRQIQASRDACIDALARARRLLEEATREEESRRAELDEAVKNVKILENLKEKLEERDKEEERRRSDKETDELTTQKTALERQLASRDA